MSDLETMKRIFEKADKQFEEFEDAEGMNVLALETEDDGDVIEHVFNEEGEFLFIRKEI